LGSVSQPRRILPQERHFLKLPVAEDNWHPHAETKAVVYLLSMSSSGSTKGAAEMVRVMGKERVDELLGIQQRVHLQPCLGSANEPTHQKRKRDVGVPRHRYALLRALDWKDWSCWGYWSDHSSCYYLKVPQLRLAWECQMHCRRLMKAMPQMQPLQLLAGASGRTALGFVT